MPEPNRKLAVTGIRRAQVGLRRMLRRRDLAEDVTQVLEEALGRTKRAQDRQKRKKPGA